MTLADYYRRETLEEDLTSSDLRLIEDYYEIILKGEYAPTSISTDLSYVKTWMQYCESREIDVTDPGKASIRDYLRRRRGNVSDSCISSTVTALRRFYKWQFEDREDDAPTAEIDPYDLFTHFNPHATLRGKALDDLYDPDELTTISPEIVEEMAKHCGAPRARNELLIKLGFQSMMRPVEMCWAKVDDINWELRRISIRTAKVDDNDDEHPYKTRFVFWQRDTDELMYRWLGGPDGDGERAAYGTSEDSPYIFLTRKKPQMRSEYYSRLVREAAERAGVQQILATTARTVPQNPDKDVPIYQISGHELRRAGITHIANKVDRIGLHELQALAGHKRISQTRSYVHDDWQEITSKMKRVSF